MKPADLGREKELLAFRLGKLLHAIRLKADHALSSQNFTMSQVIVLAIVKRTPGRSSAELARILTVTPQAMGERLAELEAAKMLERSPHPANRRKLVVKLTLAGEKKLAGCRTVMGAIEKDMLTVLSAPERAALNDMLDRCFQSIGAEPKIPA